MFMRSIRIESKKMKKKSGNWKKNLLIN